MDELNRKEDLLETLEMLQKDLVDMKDKYYKDVIDDLVIELKLELEDEQEAQQEMWESERREQIREYWADQF